VVSEASPLWQLMPKGERREEKLDLSYLGELAHVDIKTMHVHVYYVMSYALGYYLNFMSHAIGELCLMVVDKYL
jgi:hypothetical protein